MNKKILIPIIIIILIAIIVSIILFKNNDSSLEIDIEELSKQIVESGVFSDELAKIDNQIVMTDYSFTSEEIKGIVSYQGSGATSEELVVLEVNNKSFLNSVKNKIDTRLNERKGAFESYLPEEVFKIDNNLLEVKGNYLIMCISNDSNKVNEVINNYIKE